MQPHFKINEIIIDFNIYECNIYACLLGLFQPISMNVTYMNHIYLFL